MHIQYVRAPYAAESSLEAFFVGIFGPGKVRIIWKRGLFEVRMPRELKADQEQQLQRARGQEHYDSSAYY